MNRKGRAGTDHPAHNRMVGGSSPPGPTNRAPDRCAVEGRPGSAVPLFEHECRSDDSSWALRQKKQVEIPPDDVSDRVSVSGSTVIGPGDTPIAACRARHFLIEYAATSSCGVLCLPRRRDPLSRIHTFPFPTRGLISPCRFIHTHNRPLSMKRACPSSLRGPRNGGAKPPEQARKEVRRLHR